MTSAGRGVTPAERLAARARDRCHHRNDSIGFCRRCLLEEMEQMIAEENPEMKRADAFELVQEWILAADQPEL